MLVNIGDFHSFLKKINTGSAGFDEVIAPHQVSVDKDDQPSYHLKKLDEKKNPRLNHFRTIDPLKILFYLSRERVYPLKDKYPKRIAAGVKACDLKALQLLDKALLQSGFVDPAYKNWRENTLIISADCDNVHETCSCNLVKGTPYAVSGFDLNLSVINGNYFIETGSEKCRDFIELMKKEIKVTDSVPADKESVSVNREKIIGLLNEKNKKLNHPNEYSEMRKTENKNWENVSKECVGCGACTNICPTCYCLILNDESVDEQFIRVRSYDSCQWFGYARVAGGGTPRPRMTERFRNRYLCKFDYMQKNFAETGCTGCGRCTEACAAKIDFREVVKNISYKTQEVS